jgi:hypothetical protein
VGGANQGRAPGSDAGGEAQVTEPKDPAKTALEQARSEKGLNLGGQYGFVIKAPNGQRVRPWCILLPPQFTRVFLNAEDMYQFIRESEAALALFYQLKWEASRDQSLTQPPG